MISNKRDSFNNLTDNMEFAAQSRYKPALLFFLGHFQEQDWKLITWNMWRRKKKNKKDDSDSPTDSEDSGSEGTVFVDPVPAHTG